LFGGHQKGSGNADGQRKMAETSEGEAEINIHTSGTIQRRLKKRKL